MKELPISIQTFEEVINREMIYVDKTNYVHELVTKGKYYFLSRPRRFGKSMLLTTLKAFFQGKKELFKGLYISKKEKTWQSYPIIHIDYSRVSYKNGLEEFQRTFIQQLQFIALDYKITITSVYISAAFDELVIKLYRKYKKQVVVLVDEYDKPLVDTLSNPELFADNREVLRSLYGTMKGLDQYLKFVMLTGVSRFAKVGIFSGMNNLNDISIHHSFSQIVGFTQQEIETYFGDYLEKLCNKFDTSLTKLMPSIQEWYNGFSFTGTHKLYNPFSIITLLSKKEFSNYWFSTGTPTFLINLIKRQKYLPEKFERVKVHDLEGSSINVGKFSLIPLLYQTGYLTIEETGLDDFQPYYYLNYPNKEVRESFIIYLTAAFLNTTEAQLQPERFALRDALIIEDIDFFTKKLQSIFADIPGRLHIPKEAYYHSLTYLLLRLIGAKALLEKETDKGRIDAVLELEDKIYIIEFKFATSKRVKQVVSLAKKAIKQIKDNKYYEPYLGGNKKVLLLGIGFLNKKIHAIVKEV